ncbi:hypothetical protein GH714_024772 [Hevea brasiliensis]|uniref:Aminotransferase class III-fold pyridoxal phosphate-dependent enzyme n=1 Tax=Hevea brasiliensis TaxID=3981 RepID=A0A6A6MCP8_HEVBR|nr:hypothetical protein GH714_024605 [Hevea brasiliensis]KAF2311554.1 hypothetical protein GH714_024772 [Hevea brasiliensis]
MLQSPSIPFSSWPNADTGADAWRCKFTRAGFKSVGGQPIVMDSVKGSRMWDIDGNEYIDYVGSWCPAIIGHADDRVLFFFLFPPDFVINECSKEACMGVLRLARAFTGKEKLIMFEGCYQGHADTFLVRDGSDVATLCLPDSPGVPRAATSETLTVPFNDLHAVRGLFETNKGEIAPVILEPVVGNSGLIAPKPDFLEAIRRITKENNALLIVDEVMTGFRLSYGGAQEYLA